MALSSCSNAGGVACARAASISEASAATSASASSPSTMSLNMRQKRSQVSSAKPVLPVWRANATAPSALMPRLSTVSIMPGMLTWAPERTDTSSGAAGSPKRAPTTRLTSARAASTSLSRSAGSTRPLAL
jgi:hypothetical protein